MDEPQAIIDTLHLTPHPEGGWYRETWRADAPAGEGPSATAFCVGADGLGAGRVKDAR